MYQVVIESQVKIPTMEIIMQTPSNKLVSIPVHVMYGIKELLGICGFPLTLFCVKGFN